MFPTKATSLILGRRLINMEHNLSLFCPDEVHCKQAATVPMDLKIAALGLGITVSLKDKVESLKEMDYIIFPTVDMLPHNTRTEYGKMCQSLFR